MALTPRAGAISSADFSDQPEPTPPDDPKLDDAFDLLLDIGQGESPETAIRVRDEMRAANRPQPQNSQN